MIGIINYGINNIFSIKNTLDKLEISSKIILHPSQVENISKIILPGVGSYNLAMKKLYDKNWVDFLKQFVENKNNFLLGICLGMQLLASKGYEEKETEGLNLIEAEVKKLSILGCNKKLPHIGWNSIKIKKDTKIFSGIPNMLDFYFVHSYAMNFNNNVIAEVNYGKNFVAAVQKENIFGMQFHPEKSSEGGKLILKNFSEL